MHLAFSHPDCYRRYRNFTDSGKTAAGFPSQTKNIYSSLPVRIFTSPQRIFTSVLL